MEESEHLLTTRTIFNTKCFETGDFVKVVKVKVILSITDGLMSSKMKPEYTYFGFIKSVSEEGIEIMAGYDKIQTRTDHRENYKYIRIEDMQIEGTEIFIEKVDLTIFTKEDLKIFDK